MSSINNYLSGLVSQIEKSSPWTNVYGITRTLLAAGTFLTFLFNPSDILFTSLIVKSENMVGPIYLKYSFFEILKSDLDLARLLALIILLTVIIGWMPRFTATLHFWITASFMISTETPDGGDQISTILTLLIMLFAIGDDRKWHWENKKSTANFYMSAFSYSVLLMIRIQVSIIYLHAMVGKLKVNEWVNGTAAWYWFNDPTFGMNIWSSYLIKPILNLSYGVVLFTWGSLVIELILFAALFMPKDKRKHLLTVGITFHLLIVLIQGLGSFFFAMAAALVIYLRSPDDEFKFEWLNKINNSFVKKHVIRP